MQDTATYAERNVAGGTLYMRCAPGQRWEVNYWSREMNIPAAKRDGVLLSKRLTTNFEGRTFATPDEAAETVRRFLAS
jgi:hypothetical protein